MMHGFYNREGKGPDQAYLNDYYQGDINTDNGVDNKISGFDNLERPHLGLSAQK